MAQIYLCILLSWFSQCVFAESDIYRLLEVLYQPQEIEIPELHRVKYTESAKALGDLIRKNPKVLDAQAKSKIRELLSSKNPGYKAAQNDLNKYLPPEIVAELDKLVTQDRLHPSNENPCEVMCRTAERLADQVDESLRIKEDAYLENRDSRQAFVGAVRSLVGEFLIKAHGFGCKIQQIENKVKKLLTEIEEFNPDHAKKRNAYSDEAVREALRDLKDQSAAEKALEFLNKSATSSNWDGQGLPTQSAALFYLIHTYRLSQSLQSVGTVRDGKPLKTLQNQIEARLTKILGAREKLIEAQGASLVTVYSLGAVGVSLHEGNDLQKKIADVLEKKRVEMNERKVAVFPYNFANPTEILSERAGAARSVVAQLAIYKGGPEEEKLRNADHLLSSIETYNLHFRDIFSGIGLNQTHDFDEPDLLAPYYGPSTIPYVFEALSALEKEKGMSLRQKDRLIALRYELQRKVLGMFEPGGLFQQQHKGYYSAAEYYDNALVGLALENACRFQNENHQTRNRSSSSPSLSKKKSRSH